MLPLKDTNPTSGVAWVTYILIAINVIAYFVWQRGGWELDSQASFCQLVDYSAIPSELTGGENLPGKGCTGPGAGPTWITPLTSMFMHGSALHLGGNMLFLWIFGNNVEDRFGHGRFLLFYVAAGLVALALQVAFDPGSDTPTVGASGAIAGVLGAYIVLFPRARVWTWVFIIILPLRAWWVLAYWFISQALLALLDLNQIGADGVAYFAHIGGFLFGVALVKLLARRQPIQPA